MKPFVVTAGVWWALGTATTLGAGEGFLWFQGLWVLCVLNLVSLAKTVAAVMLLMSHQGAQKLAWWGSTKFFCLGILAWTIWQATRSGASMLPVLLGLSTLVIVPIVGGLWSQREISNA